MEENKKVSVCRLMSPLPHSFTLFIVCCHFVGSVSDRLLITSGGVCLSYHLICLISLFHDMFVFAASYSVSILLLYPNPLRLASKSKVKQISKPWLSDGILKSIKVKQKMFVKHMSNSRTYQISLMSILLVFHHR